MATDKQRAAAKRNVRKAQPARGTLATMGPAVPYALGAKLAHPDRPVIACLGDDPPAVKRALTRAFEALLADHEFDHLLFAHGDPVIGGGKAALRAFIKQQH